MTKSWHRAEGESCMSLYRHVVTDTGQHFIKNVTTGEEGEAANYQGIAHFVEKKTGQRFIAITGYHEHRHMQTGIVYLIQSSYHL